VSFAIAELNLPRKVLARMRECCGRGRWGSFDEAVDIWRALVDR